MADKLIWVSVRNVYGTDTVYPACADSRTFAGIAGTKTLTADTLTRISALGYEIRVETPSLRRNMAGVAPTLGTVLRTLGH